MKSTSQEIIQRTQRVKARISEAAARASREANAVLMVVASKTQKVESIRAAYRAGVRDFGENYVQEGAAKRSELADLDDLRWHLIGHLQSNKARLASESFAIIHTVDSARIAAAIRRAAGRNDFEVLIEVNIGDEAQKSGVRPQDLESLVGAIRGDVRVRGLMAVPPAGAADESRRYFAQLRELRDRTAAQTGLALSELSMGMSDDFEVAIEEGASIVRIGRAIFGERSR